MRGRAFGLAPHLKPYVKMSQLTSNLSVAFVLVASVLMSEGVADAQPYRIAPVSGSTVVDCGASRRAVVRRVRVNGRTTDRVVCVSTRNVAANRRVVRHRSWKKSALVIGGSSAAGAGVGALVGGKKGALIGAAAGGAAGTVYEVRKRHKVRRHRR